MNGLREFYRRAKHLFERSVRLGRKLFRMLVIQPVHELGSPVLRLALRIFQLFFFTLKDMSRNRTSVRTAALSFYLLFSLVPLLAVIFAAAKTMGYIDLLLENLYGLFPQSPEIVDYCVDFAERTLARTRGGWMAAVAGVAMLWSALSLIEELVKAINEPWKISSRRGLSRYGIYLGILVFFPAFWVGAEVLGIYFSDLLGLEGKLIFRVLSRAATLAIELGGFVLFYKLVPRTRVQWSSAATAGLTAGTVFLLFHWGYTSILWNVTSYNAIYGSFAALPLFLFWARYSWQILLTGNELAYAHQNLRLLREERYGVNHIKSSQSALEAETAQNAGPVKKSES